MADGFVVRNPLAELTKALPKLPESQTTAWLDPKTKLPLRIDTVTREDNVTTTEIMSIIAFDRPLDPALFDLTPPEGYKVETFGMSELRPEPAAKDKDKAAAEMVVTPLAGIGPVKFGMKAADVIRLLGQPDKTISPNKDYAILEYYSRGFSIHTTTQRSALMMMCYTGKFWAFRVRAFAGRTDKGVKMGASRADIEKAYGKPTSVDEATMKDVFGKRAANPDKKTGQVDLTYAGLGVSFTLHDNALDTIMLRARGRGRPPRRRRPRSRRPSVVKTQCRVDSSMRSDIHDRRTRGGIGRGPASAWLGSFAALSHRHRLRWPRARDGSARRPRRRPGRPAPAGPAGRRNPRRHGGMGPCHRLGRRCPAGPGGSRPRPLSAAPQCTGAARAGRPERPGR